VPYTPGGYPYNSATLPGNQGASDSISLDEWNEFLANLSNLGNSVLAGDYFGMRDMSGGLPDVAPSGEARWASNSGRAVLSRHGKAFWDPFTTLNVLEYGADRTGDTDSTDAVQEAITAMERNTSHNGQILYFPAGDYLIDERLDFSGMQGFTILGDGPYATRLKWNGSAGDDFIYAMGSQLWGIRGLTLWGKAAARPSAMIHSRMASGYRFAAYGMRFQDVLIDGQGAADEFDFGFRFSTDGSGNNSEACYLNCEVNKTKTAAVRLEGSQAKAHRFINFNAVGGEYGIQPLDSGNGAPGYSFRMGNMANFTVAAFALGALGDPIIIEDVQSEGCYRFFDGGGTPNTSNQSLRIQGCRLDCASTSPTPAYDSFVQYAGVGPFVFENNDLFGAPGNIVRVKVSTGAYAAVRLTYNRCYTVNSVSQSLLNWNTSNVGPASSVEMHSNTFLDSVGNERVLRLEGLDCGLPTGFSLANNSGNRRGEYVIGINPSLFITAALAQTVQIPLPQGVCIKGMTLYQNGRLALPGAPNITCKVGSTSGGDEYLLSTDVSLADTEWYAEVANLGAHLTTDYRPGFGYIPETNYFATSTLYITLTSSSGNLGTGAATRITGGDLYLVLNADIASRWLRVS
jgi:hypothetical protein